MKCPKCEEELVYNETDSRQEWWREYYFCDDCNKEYILLTTYQTQSDLIGSQEWED